MTRKVQRWGNGQVPRLSRQILEDAQISVGDEVDVLVQDGTIIVGDVPIFVALRVSPGLRQCGFWANGSPSDRPSVRPRLPRHGNVLLHAHGIPPMDLTGEMSPRYALSSSHSASLRRVSSKA